MTAPRPPRLAPVHHLLTAGRHLAAWPVRSQQGARRNAMLAATEIRHRRQAQEEVEAFLRALAARRTPPSPSVADAGAATLW